MPWPTWLQWFSRAKPVAEIPAVWTPPASAPTVAIEDEPKKATDIMPVLEVARQLVKWAETQDADAVWKRHQVYGRLAKAFPHRSKDVLGLLVELAVREAKYGVDLHGIARSLIGKK